MNARVLVSSCLACLAAVAALPGASGGATTPSAFFVAKQCSGQNNAQRLVRERSGRTSVFRPCRPGTDGFLVAESRSGQIGVARIGTDPGFSLEICSAKDCRPLRPPFKTANIRALALSPDGTRMMFASWESWQSYRIRVWEISISTGAVTRRSVPVPEQWDVAAIAPTGALLFSKQDANYARDDLYAGTILGAKRAIGNAAAAYSRVLAFDERVAVISTGTTRCQLIDIESQRISRIPCPKGAVAASLG